MEKTINTEPVDAVFVIGTGSRHNNEELRYALRSLEKHCPFIRNVYIVGVCPEWVNKDYITHIDWQDRFRHAKDANIVDKLRKACEYPGIAKNILFCSDDQVQTRVCAWEDFSPMWRLKFDQDAEITLGSTVWQKRVKLTLERERDRRKENNLPVGCVYFFEPHIWSPIDRDLFKEYAEWSDYPNSEATITQSGYYNFINIEGTRLKNHIFLRPGEHFNEIKYNTVVHIAYSDRSYNEAMEYLKNKFPERSKYEQSVLNMSKNKLLALKYVAKVTNTIDIKKLEEILNLIKDEPVWNSLYHELEDAIELRKYTMTGWEIVLKDVFTRWVKHSENFTRLSVIPKDRSPEAIKVLDQVCNISTLLLSNYKKEKESTVVQLGSQTYSTLLDEILNFD